MPKYYESIPDDLRDWALSQPLFFTATAPRTGRHVNLSPKGLVSSTFSIFDPNHAGYIDATGSGCETISHLYENGRITIMFCSFEKTPRIMRFFCTGRVVEWDDPRFGPLVKSMAKGGVKGARAVILLDVFKVQTSCGYGVPLLANASHEESAARSVEQAFDDRPTLEKWAMNKLEKNDLRSYQKTMNAHSLDGLAGLRAARRDRGEWMLYRRLTGWTTDVFTRWDAIVMGMVLQLLLLLSVQWLGLQIWPLQMKIL